MEGAVGERAVGQDDGDATAGLGEAVEKFEEKDFEALGAATNAEVELAQDFGPGVRGGFAR